MNKKDEVNLTKCSNSCCCGEDSPKQTSKYDNTEPLPESTRPRRDGPGGENAK